MHSGGKAVAAAAAMVQRRERRSPKWGKVDGVRVVFKKQTEVADAYFCDVFVRRLSQTCLWWILYASNRPPPPLDPFHPPPPPPPPFSVCQGGGGNWEFQMYGEQREEWRCRTWLFAAGMCSSSPSQQSLPSATYSSEKRRNGILTFKAIADATVGATVACGCRLLLLCNVVPFRKMTTLLLLAWCFR